MSVLKTGKGVSSTESPDVIDTHGSIFMTNSGRGILDWFLPRNLLIWLLMDFISPPDGMENEWRMNSVTHHTVDLRFRKFRKNIHTHASIIVEHGKRWNPGRMICTHVSFRKCRLNHNKRILIKRRNKKFLLPTSEKIFFFFLNHATEKLPYRTKDPYFH